MSGVDLSVLVVSWNTRDHLRECLRSALAAVEGLRAEVIVVDNASADGSAEMTRREFVADARVRLIANERNELFARGSNRAFALSRGELILLQNPDLILTREALRRMIDHLRSHPGAGIVSCNLIGADGRAQTIHRAFPTLPIVFSLWNRLGRRLDRWILLGLNKKRYLLRTRRRRGPVVVDQAAAACLLIRRATIDRIGGLFDERFPLYFNDVDLSRRVRDAGLQVHVLYDVSLIHARGASIGRLHAGERKVVFLESLGRYYDVHEPPWKARLVRLMLAGDRRRAARAHAAARPTPPR